ncbi:MAG TPA: hypothetical protein VIH46_09485 [Candidatus Acidoferrales bacterium]
MPPAFTSRVTIRVDCGPAGLKQIVQATGEFVEIRVVAAGVEILKLKLAPNHAGPLPPGVACRVVGMASPGSPA